MPDLGEPLSRRERDVLQAMMNSGASNKEIATALVISPNTVKVHVRNIFKKMGVSSRTEAVALALKEELFATPSSVDNLPTKPEAVVVDTPIAVDTPIVLEAVTSAEVALPANESPPQRRWLFTGIALLLLITIILIALFAKSSLSPTPPPPTFEPIPLSERGWTQTQPLTEARSGMTLNAIGLTLYQIGGKTEQGISNDVYAFNTRERLWQQQAAKPTAVTNASSVLILGQLFVLGGETEQGATAAAEVYSPTSDAWRAVASLPRPLAGALALAHNEQIYLFGGVENNNYSDQAFVYDLSNDSWRPLPAMQQARAHTIGGVIGNNIIIVGGTDGENELAQCELFDPLQEAWSVCPAMLEARARADAVALAGKLYVVGGGTTHPVKYGEVFDSVTATWQVLNVPLFDSAENLLDPAMTIAETSIYIIGGIQNNSLQNGVYFYQPFQNLYYLPSASSGK